MTSDRWQQISELFHAVEQLPRDERDAYLRDACGDDDALREEIRSLLSCHDEPSEFLDDDAIGGALRVWDAEGGEAADDPAIGTRIGPYRIDERIAAGGMGTVYRASRQDGHLEQVVAIKLLHPWCSSRELVERFQVEWQTLADLGHANIAQVLDAGLTKVGTPYLVMEYLRGVPVDRYCDTAGLDVRQRLELFEDIARTVHHAHQNLVVHRDLKPANILVTEHGQPKLLDFGIAKILRPDRGAIPTDTATQTMIMTPDYASPEQLRGEPVTTATDIYSLGVLLYELLTGRRPHAAATTSSTRIRQMLGDREPPRPSTAILQPPTTKRGEESVSGATAESIARLRSSTTNRLRRQLRGDLDTIVMTAMHFDPRRRYASAERLAEDIRSHLDGHPVAARSDSFVYRAQKFVARNRLATAAGLLAAVAIVAGTATTAWLAQIARRERDDARLAEARAEEERDHARIEADSAQQLVEILSDAFGVSARQRTPDELATISDLLARHVYRVRRQYANDDHERANLLDAIGRAHLELGQFDPATELIDEAASIRERTFGTASLESALSFASRGNLAYQRGDLSTAVECFRRALDLQRTMPPGVHTDVARSANDLAVVLRLTGETDAAESLHEEALALRRQTSGDDHLVVAESLNNLSAIHAQRGDYERAEQESSQVLAIRRSFLGDRHPLVAQALNNLAAIAHWRGQPDECRRLLEQAVALYRSMPGSEQALGGALSNLANFLRTTGKAAAAHDAASEALALHRSRLGSQDHPDVAHALHALGDTNRALKHRDEAKAHFAEALAMRRRIYPTGHTKIGETLCNYGVVLAEAHDAAAAEPLLREALAILGAAQPTHSFVVAAERGLAACLVELERYAEAEPLLLAAYERLRGDEAERDRTAAKIKRLYRAWGKPERADAFGK